MLWIVIGFLGVSLLLYCVLGGADFGAGALEFFIRKKDRARHEELVAKAMGPVWEANHIWLIILIVILFNGFPKVYAEFSIYFHIPLTLMLVGIIFRGCAFTFRHYDAVQDETHHYYSLAFALSSLLTPIMFGMIVGGLILGVDPNAATYGAKFVAPWFNFFSLSVGIFVLSLFSYLASVYLIGETKDSAIRAFYVAWAKRTNLALIVTGAVVFILAEAHGHHLLRLFFSNALSIACFVVATFAAIVFWWNIQKGKIATGWTIRTIAAGQAALVLIAFLVVIFPDVLFYAGGSRLSLFEAAAPAASINVLAWALMIGSLFFLPILIYLIKVFKINSSPNK